MGGDAQAAGTVDVRGWPLDARLEPHTLDGLSGWLERWGTPPSSPDAHVRAGERPAVPLAEVCGWAASWESTRRTVLKWARANSAALSACGPDASPPSVLAGIFEDRFGLVWDPWIVEPSLPRFLDACAGQLGPRGMGSAKPPGARRACLFASADAALAASALGDPDVCPDPEVVASGLRCGADLRGWDTWDRPPAQVLAAGVSVLVDKGGLGFGGIAVPPAARGPLESARGRAVAAYATASVDTVELVAMYCTAAEEGFGPLPDGFAPGTAERRALVGYLGCKLLVWDQRRLLDEIGAAYRPRSAGYRDLEDVKERSGKGARR